MSSSLAGPTLRLLEEAADELGRLDSLAQLAPPAFAHAARGALLAQLEASPDALVALTAAGVDPVHAAALAPSLNAWAAVVDEEVRRVRSGVPLAAKRFSGVGDIHALEELEQALRSSGELRSVLLRGVGAAAAVGSGPLAELVPALLLCATGHFDRPWILPFADVEPASRDEGLVAWREGDLSPLRDALLSACSTTARSRRLAIRRLLQTLLLEDESLGTLGRAAITARRALAVLRDSLAISMPSLAERLECSRPAAGDALERLVHLKLAREITGRDRDRVFVHAATWDSVT